MEVCMMKLVISAMFAVSLAATATTARADDFTGRWYHAMSNPYINMTSELAIQPNGTYDYHMTSKVSAGCEQGYIVSGKWTAVPGAINFAPVLAKRGCSGGEIKISPQKDTKNTFNSTSRYHMVGGNLC